MNELLSSRIQLLMQHRLLPAQGDAQALGPDPDSSRNLFHLLLRAWSTARGASRSRAAQRRIGHRVAWLEAQLRQRATLTWGFPDDSHARVSSWIGERLIWWPRGVPVGRRIAFVSSRLTRPLEQQTLWFAALRQVCRTLDADREILVAARATAAAPFLGRCPELFQTPLLEFVSTDRASMTLTKWLDKCARLDTPEPRPSAGYWSAIVSPLLVPCRNDPTPLRDRLVVATADRIVAGRVRPGGHIETLLGRRLKERSADARLCLLLTRGLVSPRAAEPLLQAGATAWTVADSMHTANLPPGQSQGAILDMPSATQISQQAATSEYLTHCTRSAAGPWPDQTLEDYQDSLVLGRVDADHSPLAVLTRIVLQQRLLASDKAIRGGFPVVCFTAVEVRRIAQLHTFRAHRRRWDFEPYGICIKTSWLRKNGARPVRYGDAAIWQNLTESERPFYQRRYAGKRGQIDWSLEREWRHRGTVDLSRLGASEAFLFVPTAEEAATLAPLSRWPVVVLH